MAACILNKMFRKCYNNLRTETVSKQCQMWISVLDKPRVRIIKELANTGAVKKFRPKHCKMKTLIKHLERH